MNQNKQIEIWSCCGNLLTQDHGLDQKKHNYKFCNFNFYKNSHAAMAVDLMKNGIRIQLYINDKTIYDYLVKHRNEIHDKLGYELVWYTAPSKEAFRVYKMIESSGYEYKKSEILAKEIIENVYELKEVLKNYLP